MLPPFGDELEARVRANLAAHERRDVPLDGRRHAAVAVTLVADADGAPCFVLTRRAPRMRAHAGQWALPGGRVDQGETFEAAARREVHEEIGLVLATDAHLGALEGYETRSGYFIVPHVYWCENLATLAPNPAEVAGVHHIALTALHSPGSPEFLAGDTPGRPILRLHLGRDHVHAPTAALLYQFREVALSGRYISVAHYDQPDFARR